MRHVAFDTETFLITQDNPVPAPVVCSWASDSTVAWLTRPGDEATRRIIEDFDTILYGVNISYDILTTMRWQPWSVPAWIHRLENGLVRDVGLIQCLDHLSEHGGEGYPQRYSLAALEKIHLGRDRSAAKKGDDAWRLRYGTLAEVPTFAWPSEARQYPLDDALGTWMVAASQGAFEHERPTQQWQMQGDWALKMTSAYGMMVNQQHLAKLDQELKAQQGPLAAALRQYGWTAEDHKAIMRARNMVKNGPVPDDLAAFGFSTKGADASLRQAVLMAYVRKQKEIVAHQARLRGWPVDLQRWPALSDLTLQFDPQTMDPARQAKVSWEGEYALFPPFDWCPSAPQRVLQEMVEDEGFPRPEYTTKGVKTDSETIEKIKDVMPQLAQKVELAHIEKMISTYIDSCRDVRCVHPDFTTLLSTGRTGAKDPNSQNIPRDGGFRDIFIPRPGMMYGCVDYGALELCTLAATISYYWPSVEGKLAAAINAGKDPHCMVASVLIDKPYEVVYAGRKKEYKDIRQGSKACSFGIPGGLGKPALRAYAASTYGVNWTLEQTETNWAAYHRTFPEVGGVFLDHFKRQIRNGRGLCASQLINGRVKAKCRFTQACNFEFQGLAADGAKRALYLVVSEALASGWLKAGGQSALLQPFAGSPLADSHPANFVHDEILMEHLPGDAGQAALKRQETIMVEAMTAMTQGLVKITVEGKLSEHWSH